MNAQTKQFYDYLRSYRDMRKDNKVDTPDWLNPYLNAILSSIEKDQLPDMELIKTVKEHLNTSKKHLVDITFLDGPFLEILRKVTKNYLCNYHP